MHRDKRTLSMRRYSKKGRGNRNIRIPYEAIGSYYDELPTRTRDLYWLYRYDGAFTTSQAEALELRYGSGTLHFKCRLKGGEMPEGLEDTLDEIDALMGKI